MAAPSSPAPASRFRATSPTVVHLVSSKDKAEPWPYIIRLTDEPLATYRGGIGRLRPTSPRVTGQQKLDVASQASQAYLGYLADQQTQFITRLAQVVGRPINVLYTYKVAYNGVVAVLTPAEAERVAELPGVVSIQRDELQQLLTDVTPDFIGATAIWDSSAAGVITGTKGEGVIVGVLDTGIWPEHPSFADDGTYPQPPDNWGGDCTPPEDDVYSCNNKLIGIQYFLEAYVETNDGYDGLFLSGRDDNGHGTHTASTAAGNENVTVTLLGVDRGTISGIAPRAHVAMYKVCGPQGCNVSDSVAATEQAILDGVDVINFSISGGVEPYDDPAELAFLAAREAGVFVAAAAGNGGPDGGTANHLGPWLTTVGASTSNRLFISEIALSGPGEPPTGLFGATVTDGITGFNLVDAEGIPDSAGDDSGLCLHPFPEGTFQPTDAVLCRRGEIARVLRGEHVAAGGGGAVILYNPVQQGLATDNYVIPAVHVEHDVGQQIKNYITQHPGEVTVSFTPGTAAFASDDPRVMPDMLASFSSRGANGAVPGVIKPDVTAPGVQILAGNTPQCLDPRDNACGARGQLFRAMQGTSMSSPHVAGAGALLRAVHPEWSPAAMQSALMTTALTDVVKEDGETPAGPFDMGAGRIDLTRAADPGLVFDMTAQDYLDGETDPANMNVPTLGFGQVFGHATITRTATSLVAADTTWTVTVDAPAGVEVTVSPDPLEVPANGTVTFQVSVDAVGTPADQYFAQLYLGHGSHQVHMPIAFENVPTAWSSLGNIKTQFDVGQIAFDLLSSVDQDPFVINAYGLADPVRTAGGPLDQDPDQNTNTDPLGEGFALYTYTITSDVLWFVAQTRDSEIRDLDLFLLYDADGSGTFDWPGELIDADQSPDPNEEVDIALPASGEYLVAVHAWAGSGTFTLKTYEVTKAALGQSLEVLDAPESITAGSAYTMQVAWDHQIDQGEDYFGMVTLGTEDDPIAIGFAPMRVVGDVPAVDKAVNRDKVPRGEGVDYQVVLANTDVEERDMELTDVIPDSLEIDPASIVGDATLSDGTVTWRGALPPAEHMVVIGPSAHFGYVSLAGLGVSPISIDDLDLDDVGVNIDINPVAYLGVEYERICAVTNGYVVMGGCTSSDDVRAVPQKFPDTAPPNTVIAPLWMDFDLDGGDGIGGGTWYAARVLGDGNAWIVVEWENVQRKGEEDTAFTFQVWLKEATEEVTLTYARLDGPRTRAAVGAENAAGTVGAIYHFDDGEGTEIGTFPSPDDILDVSQGVRPARHTITYSAEAQAEGHATNLATVTSGVSRDSDRASTTVLPPPRPGTFSLLARVFLDIRCDTFFISGVDRALAGVPVTLTLSNGAAMTRNTLDTGLVLFSGFDVSDLVTVSAELPDEYRGWLLAACINSPTTVTLTAEDFGSLRSTFVDFRAEVRGEAAGP